MKRISTLFLTAGLAVGAVSCKSSTDNLASNPYEDNPYYGPTGGSSAPASSGDYAAVAPAAPNSNYVPPAPAAPAYTPPAAPYTPPSAPAYKPPAAPATNYGGTSSHLVSKGDTLYGLSKRYGTSVAAIQSANGLNDSTIVLGTSLNIPRG